MKRVILVFLGFICITGCKTPCSVEQTAANGISNSIAATLQCSGTEAINADIMKLLDKANVCGIATPAVKGIIGSTVCPLVGNLALSELGNQVPATWQCSLVNAKATLGALISTACQSVPF